MHDWRAMLQPNLCEYRSVYVKPSRATAIAESQEPVTPQQTGTLDLRSYLRIVWRWKLLLLALVVVLPLAAYLEEASKPKTYQSSTLLELQNISIDVGTSSAPIVTGNIDAIARLVTTTPVARVANKYLHPPVADPVALVGSVDASANSDTGFLTISAGSTNPSRAAAIANAFAHAISDHQTSQAVLSINEEIAADQKQLSAVPRHDAADRLVVLQEIARLQGLRGATRSGAQVIEAATPNPTPVGPGVHRSVELALLIAIMLGIGGVVLAENLDRRLRTPEDLETLTKWPLLGSIPAAAFESGDSVPGPEQEAFHMLNASLALFTLDEPVSSVGVISPLVADGKTTVALGLARAATRAGQRVILVDADLRRPQITSRLGLNPSGGVVAALAGQEELDDILVPYDVDAPDGAELRILPAGPVPPNPVAILSSPQMRTLIARLEEMADLVIVDTAATLAVSDSLPLLRTVSGVMVVVRMNRSVSGPIRRLLKVLSSAHVNVLGSVATGSESAEAGYGDYDYYYAPDPAADGRTRRLRRRRLHPQLSKVLAGSHQAPPNGNGNGHSSGNGKPNGSGDSSGHATENGRANGNGRANTKGAGTARANAKATGTVNRTTKERKNAVNSLLGGQREEGAGSADVPPPTASSSSDEG